MAKEESLPHSLTMVSACLEGFKPPAGPFDPQGAWEHRYAVWVLFLNAPSGGNRLSNAAMSRSMGAFRIHRKLENDAAALEIGLATRQGWGGASIYRVDARLMCNTDRLATPRSWELRTTILDQKNQPVDGTQAQETGQVAGGVIRRRGKVERTIPAPKSFTSNWSLFDALQRLPGNEVEPMTFDMLEEMDLLKPGQRLAYRQSVEIALGGRTVKLHGFEQIGEGILPYSYWLDDQRRLLFAIGAMRAYLFDPSAQLPEVSK